MHYKYKAVVTKVYDGDTITVDIDLGFGIIMKKQSIRLYGINTPEIKGEERPKGLEARDYLSNLVLNKEINLETIKDKKGKYGRILGIIWLEHENINDKLIREGYAKIY